MGTDFHSFCFSRILIKSGFFAGHLYFVSSMGTDFHSFCFSRILIKSGFLQAICTLSVLWVLIFLVFVFLAF